MSIFLLLYVKIIAKKIIKNVQARNSGNLPTRKKLPIAIGFAKNIRKKNMLFFLEIFNILPKNRKDSTAIM